MAAIRLPNVGDWYVTAVGDTFEVVAFDEDEESVEIQHLDGALEELDLETWLDIGAEATEPPEDWRGSLDVMGEDIGIEDRPRHPTGGNPLDDLDSY
jgi:hypothetical protein